MDQISGDMKHRDALHHALMRHQKGDAWAYETNKQPVSTPFVVPPFHEWVRANSSLGETSSAGLRAESEDPPYTQTRQPAVSGEVKNVDDGTSGSQTQNPLRTSELSKLERYLEHVNVMQRMQAERKELDRIKTSFVPWSKLHLSPEQALDGYETRLDAHRAGLSALQAPTKESLMEYQDQIAERRATCGIDQASEPLMHHITE